MLIGYNKKEIHNKIDVISIIWLAVRTWILSFLNWLSSDKDYTLSH
jgi:hypothetical protein